jgi:hypothetical protein
MKTHKFKIILPVIYILILIRAAYGTGFLSLNDCLVTSDIGIYSYRSRGANMSAGSGLLAAAGHFIKDHTDNVCGGSYSNINQLRGLSAEQIEEQLISVKVQVTQHPGGESDKWLSHELERDFRNYYGLPGDSYVMRVIDGNTIMAAGSGGWDYRWLM